jgi:hypothetical protein
VAHADIVRGDLSDWRRRTPGEDNRICPENGREMCMVTKSKKEYEEV